MSSTVQHSFFIRPNVSRPVDPKRAQEAAEIDKDHDGVCSDAEIEAYMRAHEIIEPAPRVSNVPQLVAEFKTHLAGVPKAHFAKTGDDYHSLDQINDSLRQLATDHPDRAQLVSIAKSVEGRDIWALKISSNAAGDTSVKPGVVLTGTHHAREWMTPEVMLGLAKDMVENYDNDPDMKRRVDNAETWILPVVNPDGFVYSQTTDNMWRKNRAPIPDACSTDGKRPDGDPVAYGVDLNRNYWDGKPEHMSMYRVDSDKPCDTSDDYGASDDPQDESYRGTGPASEPEVQGLMAFEYGRPNIHGIIDHHSYGRLLMRPWDHIPDAPPEIKDYDEIAARMQAAQSAKGEQPYEYIQTYDLYPTTGASVSCHEANGRYAFGIEMGDSFQPPFSEYESTYKSVAPINLTFIDWIMEKFPAPQTPAPTDPAPPVPTPAPEPPPGTPSPRT